MYTFGDEVTETCLFAVAASGDDSSWFFDGVLGSFSFLFGFVASLASVPASCIALSRKNSYMHENKTHKQNCDAK